MRVHWTLHELGLDYETREIITRSESMDDPEFRALSQRRGKIPFFQEGDLVLGESAAIARQLADHHRRSVTLSPEPGSPERARFDELCFFVMVELDAALYTIRKHEGLPDVYGASPVACEAARVYFGRQAGHLEAALADSRPYLMGEAFNVADLLFASCLDWARFIEIELSERLARYQEQIAARPAYQQAWKANFPPAALAALAG